MISLFYWRLFKKIIKKCLTCFRNFRDRSRRLRNSLWKMEVLLTSTCISQVVFQDVCFFFFLAPMHLVHIWESMGSLGHYDAGFHALEATIIKLRFPTNQIRSNHAKSRHPKDMKLEETRCREEGISGDGRETKKGDGGWMWSKCIMYKNVIMQPFMMWS